MSEKSNSSCTEIFFSGTSRFSGYAGTSAAVRDVFLDAEACALKTLELMYCRAQVQMRPFRVYTLYSSFLSKCLDVVRYLHA